MITKMKSFKYDKYYRAEDKYLGETFDFLIERGCYYEKIGKDNQPVFFFGEWKVSDIPEIAASKFVGGAVMGAFSMRHAKKYFIYAI